MVIDMTPTLFSDMIAYVITALALLLWLFLCVRFIKNMFLPVKTTRATVCNKYTVKTSAKTPSPLSPKKYMVVFSAGEKRLSFQVSEFSYNGYNLGEKGALTYKGNRIIDFK